MIERAGQIGQYSAVFFQIISLGAALVLQAEPRAAQSQESQPVESVEAIQPPTHPLPPEEDSKEVNRFSFIVYGDTRGRRDGKEIQYEHSLIVDSMLATMKKLEKSSFPVRFILQSGDAVVNGRDPKQWNRSFVGLINRITTEGGVPYFLAPGNHDITGSQDVNNPQRKTGLTNYLAAIAHLIPPDGARRRLDGFPCFAFGYGNSFFVALDSNLGSNSTQLAWVTGQLEGLDRSRYTHVFGFFHHPPFSSGPHGGSKVEAAAAELRSSYMPLFRQYHVEALFCGHEHLFEHWIERYQDEKGKKRRMDILVTGGGGAPLYSYRGEPYLGDYLKAFESEKVSLEHWVKPGMERGESPYHYVVVRVDGGAVSLEVIGVDWGSEFKPYRSNKATLDENNE